VSGIPTSFQDLFLTAAPAFTQPGLQNFMVLISGWICCTGRHTLTGILRAVWPQARRKHFSAYYRFLASGQWALDAVGRVLLYLCLPFVPEEQILAIVDDTLNKKSGPHLFGAGMHHDASRSTYGRNTAAGRKVCFSYGHRFVVLSIWVALPWNPIRGVALPVLFRLYRSKKRTPPSQYRKATELALEMIGVLASWLPADRRLLVEGDCEYACKTVVRGLPEGVDFIGPVRKEAALYELPPTVNGSKTSSRHRARRGAPRRRGRRLPTLKQWAEETSSGSRFRRGTLSIYGREVPAQLKDRICLWYRVAYRRPVRVVLVRDPRKHYEDQGYFSTDLSLAPEQIVQRFARRWSLEVTFRDTKQFLGLEDPQNGWWRRRKNQRRRKKKAGPQPHATRGAQAVERTAPLALVAYTFVHLWYFEHGRVRQDVRLARAQAPWYTNKRWPSFQDMLTAARREFWRDTLSRHLPRNRVSQQIRSGLALLGIPA